MLDPYRMVFINSIALLFLLCSLIISIYISPKKKVNLLYLLLALSLLPLISLLRAGTYESGDLSINVYKSISFYKNLTEGNILPQWGDLLNAGFGYPVFIFIYPLPYYIISFFHFLGFSFISSVKLLIAGSFICSGIAMYAWTKEDVGKIPAFVSSIFYLYAPYHLVDTHFRISIGEIISFALLPFLLFCTKKLLTHNGLIWLAITSVGFSLFILSNQAIALAGSPFILLYSYFTWRQDKKRKILQIRNVFLAFGFGLLLSAFYWLPAVAESSYTHQSRYV